jgi:hypothetical protein
MNDTDLPDDADTPAPKNKGGRPKKADDGTKGTFVVKGISNETKAAVKKAAKQQGVTIGAWVDRVLLDAAQADVSGNREVGRTADDMSQQNLELLAKLAEKVDSLEKKYNKPFLSRLFGG